MTQELKDPLQYTEQELRNLSIQELKQLLKDSEYKESLYNTRQLTEKVLINGLYGAMANRYFPLFNEDMAAAITGNGRYFIQKLAIYIEEALQKLIPSEKPYVVGGDTDSLYVTIENFMNLYQEKNPGLSINEYVDWADNFEKKIIKPIIQKTIDDFSYELNAYNKEKIGVEREVISDAAVFTAKKHYYMRVRDNEGTRYPENSPKIKIMGLEIIKSSTPKWSQKYLKEAIECILDKDETALKQWLANIKSEYLTVGLNEIAHVGGVSNLNYTLGDKGVPIGSRAALVHNKYIIENNLVDKYNLIVPDDKCKRLFLIEPNKFNSNIIAYIDDRFIEEIPREFIDYDTNFEKQFMNPMMLMVETLGYNMRKETQELDEW